MEVNHRSALVSHGVCDVWMGCTVAIRFEPMAEKVIRPALMQAFVGRQDCDSLRVSLVILAVLAGGWRLC